MPKALVAPQQLSIPQSGVIEGGLLDGWKYTFLRLVYLNGRIYFDVRTTRPHWPFPKTVRLGSADFLKLANPSATVERLDTLPLIDAAVEAAGKNK